MKPTTNFPTVLLALWLAAQSCAVQAQDGEWVSYRDAYKAMVVFAKYGKAKHLLQAHYQVSPKDSSTSLEGLQLTLSGKSSQLNLPLDAAGRITFPLLKAAYDENAVLALNRKASLYTFQPRVSIATRTDGVYEAADLRAACEQALQYQRFLDASSSSKRCVGVRLAFVRKADAHVLVREAGREQVLAVADGPAFDGDATAFRTVTYRFADAADKGQLVSQNVPLAIAPLFD